MFWLQENLILMKEMFNWLDVHNFLKNTYLNQKYHLFKSLEYFFKREATLVKITLGESHLKKIVETIWELNISLLPCQINCSQVLALNTMIIRPHHWVKIPKCFGEMFQMQMSWFVLPAKIRRDFCFIAVEKKIPRRLLHG